MEPMTEMDERFVETLGRAVDALEGLNDDLMGPDCSEDDYNTSLVMLTSYLLGTLMATLCADEEHLARGIKAVGKVVRNTANRCFAGRPWGNVLN